jgi:glucose/arabinose dehydrogenase
MICHRCLLYLTVLLTTCFAAGCGSSTSAIGADGERFAHASVPFAAVPVAVFDEPWAMTFLPDGRLLVSEKAGRLRLATTDGAKSPPLSGVREVDYGGQGGLGDVILHPDFGSNGLIYISFAEAGEGDTRGAAVARARLVLEAASAGAAGTGALADVEVIWRQHPKVTGRGHFGHRLAFSPDGYLFVTSGERQKFDPAQDLQQNLGKILRLRDDGSVPSDNPFADADGVAAQIWTLGHRNPLGIAFDSQGRLWSQEMGPRHGDELNLIVRGRNYGYPLVSEGDHYSGAPIPDHETRPDLSPPVVAWVPAISPAGLMIYSAERFADWQGSAFIGGLSSKALVRVAFDGDSAKEAERFDMRARIREAEQGPDGAIWLLEDGEDGRLLKLTPL